MFDDLERQSGFGEERLADENHVDKPTQVRLAGMTELEILALLESLKYSPDPDSELTVGELRFIHDVIAKRYELSGRNSFACDQVFDALRPYLPRG